MGLGGRGTVLIGVVFLLIGVPCLLIGVIFLLIGLESKAGNLNLAPPLSAEYSAPMSAMAAVNPDESSSVGIVIAGGVASGCLTRPSTTGGGNSKAGAPNLGRSNGAVAGVPLGVGLLHSSKGSLLSEEGGLLMMGSRGDGGAAAPPAAGVICGWEGVALTIFSKVLSAIESCELFIGGRGFLWDSL